MKKSSLRAQTVKSTFCSTLTLAKTLNSHRGYVEVDRYLVRVIKVEQLGSVLVNLFMTHSLTRHG